MTLGVTKNQRDALRLLAGVVPNDVYLAGGVAVALRFAHRNSHDLDLFAPDSFDPEKLAERLTAALPPSALSITSTAAGTLYFELGGVPASLMSYRYPLLAPADQSPDLGVRIASPDDLVCMKLSAVASRGQARDFWDLRVLLEHGATGGSLSSALTKYQQKFTTNDIGHVVRGLAYFGDADAAPLPRGLEPAHWSGIKDWFLREVSALE